MISSSEPSSSSSSAFTGMGAFNWAATAVASVIVRNSAIQAGNSWRALSNANTRVPFSSFLSNNNCFNTANPCSISSNSRERVMNNSIHSAASTSMVRNSISLSLRSLSPITIEISSNFKSFITTADATRHRWLSASASYTSLRHTSTFRSPNRNVSSKLRICFKQIPTFACFNFACAATS